MPSYFRQALLTSLKKMVGDSEQPVNTLLSLETPYKGDVVETKPKELNSVRSEAQEITLPYSEFGQDPKFAAMSASEYIKDFEERLAEDSPFKKQTSAWRSSARL
jgi:hypothetical protein